MTELLNIAKKLARAAERWPLSEDRRLDVLRLAKRIRMDAMTDQDIELVIISAAADGDRYIDDFCDTTGLSKKETTEILQRLWMQGTLIRGEERVHDRGRPRFVFTLAGGLSSKEFYSLPDDLELLP